MVDTPGEEPEETTTNERLTELVTGSPQGRLRRTILLLVVTSGLALGPELWVAAYVGLVALLLLVVTE